MQEENFKNKVKLKIKSADVLKNSWNLETSTRISY